MLDKAAGNFLTMVENVGQLLRVPPNFVDRDPTAALSPAGERKVQEWESERQRLVEQRFSNLEKDAPGLQELLGWGSHLGMRFLREVVEQFAERIAGQSGAGALLAEAVDPLVILGEPSAQLREFRDKAFHHVAARHFRDYGEEHADALQEVLKSHLIEWVNNAFDEVGNAIWPDAERGIDAPPRSVTALPSEEARDLLVMAVVHLPLAASPEWEDVAAAAAIRSRVLAIANDASERLWDRVRKTSVACAEIEWRTVPLNILALSGRERLASDLRCAGAVREGLDLQVDVVARMRVQVLRGDRESSELALALMALGDAHLQCTDLASADRSYREAMDALADHARQFGWSADIQLSCAEATVKRGAVVGMYDRAAGRTMIDEAVGHIRRCGDHAMPARWQRLLADALMASAEIALAIGDVVWATNAIAEVVAIRRALSASTVAEEDGHALVKALTLMAEAHLRDGTAGEAREYADEALAVAESLVEAFGTPSAWGYLGLALSRRGQCEEACAQELMSDEELDRVQGYFVRAQECARRTHEVLGTPESLHDVLAGAYKLGELAAERGDWRTAWEIFNKCRDELDTFAAYSGTIMLHEDRLVIKRMCGKAAAALGMDDDAERLLQEFVVAWESLRESEANHVALWPAAIAALIELGEVRERVGQDGEAEPAFRRCVELCREARDRRVLKDVDWQAGLVSAQKACMRIAQRHGELARADSLGDELLACVRGWIASARDAGDEASAEKWSWEAFELIAECRDIKRLTRDLGGCQLHAVERLAQAQSMWEGEDHPAAWEDQLSHANVLLWCYVECMRVLNSEAYDSDEEGQLMAAIVGDGEGRYGLFKVVELCTRWTHALVQAWTDGVSHEREWRCEWITVERCKEAAVLLEAALVETTRSETDRGELDERDESLALCVSLRARIAAMEAEIASGDEGAETGSQREDGGASSGAT